MAQLGARDVIQNGRQDGRHFGFHLTFEYIRKTQKLQIYFAKYETVKHFAAFSSVLKVF